MLNDLIDIFLFLCYLFSNILILSEGNKNSINIYVFQELNFILLQNNYPLFVQNQYNFIFILLSLNWILQKLKLQYLKQTFVIQIHFKV